MPSTDSGTTVVWLGHVRTEEDRVGLRTADVHQDLVEQVAAGREWVVVGDLAEGSGEEVADQCLQDDGLHLTVDCLDRVPGDVVGHDTTDRLTAVRDGPISCRCGAPPQRPAEPDADAGDGAADALDDLDSLMRSWLAIPPSRSAASAPADARNHPVEPVPRSPLAQSSPPTSASRHPIDRSSRLPVGPMSESSPHALFAASGETRNDTPDAHRSPPTTTASQSCCVVAPVVLVTIDPPMIVSCAP